MFSRKTCYFFVRPKQKYLELCVFLGRRLEAPQVRRVDQASKSKLYHLSGSHTGTRSSRRSPTGFRKRTCSRTNSQSRVPRNRLPPGRRQRHGNPRVLSSRKRFSERRDRLRNAVCRSNWPAFAGCARRFRHDSEARPLEGLPVILELRETKNSVSENGVSRAVNQSVN
jgi:hypothetical protein